MHIHFVYGSVSNYNNNIISELSCCSYIYIYHRVKIPSAKFDDDDDVGGLVP
jgi:hypothetical protein